jgi:uncharacterized membrane protein
MLLPIHIAAGSLAMILGAIALSARKGSKLHRRSGQVFVYAMVIMGITAAMLGNIGGGLMAVYFVITALTTVRPAAAWTRWLNAGALSVAAVLALGTINKGFVAFGSPRGVLNGVPFFMLFFIGTILLLAAIGDVRVMWSGPLRGAPRLARHIWRMCFALFIAAGSFFSIEARVAKILPAFLATPLMRALPVLLVFVAMFYWLWRVRGRRFVIGRTVIVRHETV